VALNEEGRLTIKIAAEDLTGPGFSGAETKMGKFKSAIGGVVGALTGAGAATLVGALSDAARAAAEDEASVVQLTQAVENSGVSWAENADVIRDRIKAGQGLAFTDTQIRESLSLLVAQTDDVDEALRRQKLAMDLSRGANIDLYTASKLLGKVNEENVNVLGRYGIVVAKGATETELFAAVQAKFGGQAEAYGNTTSAAIFKTRDAISEWTESIGASLGPAQGFIALLPGMSAGLTLIGSGAGAAGSALTALTGVTLASAAPFIAAAAAIALVGVAVWQVAETVKVVTDNWNVFVYALQNGKLNDIPIFGFFFQKAQQLLGVIDGIRNAWNAVSSLIGQGQQSAPPAENFGGGGGGGMSFASGTSFVPRTGFALLHQGEAVIPAGANRVGGGSPTIVINVSGNVTRSEEELAGRISDVIVRQLLAQRQMSY